MKNWKTLFLPIVLLFVLGLLAGCSGEPKEEPTAPGASGASSASGGVKSDAKPTGTSAPATAPNPN